MKNWFLARITTISNKAWAGVKGYWNFGPTNRPNCFVFNLVKRWTNTFPLSSEQNVADCRKEASTRKEQIISAVILMTLYQPFRLNDKKRHLAWEGVYILEKLLIVCAAVLIIHRIGKLILIIMLLIVYLIIHIRMRPYQVNLSWFLRVLVKCPMWNLYQRRTLNQIQPFTKIDLIHFNNSIRFQV